MFWLWLKCRFLSHATRIPIFLLSNPFCRNCWKVWTAVHNTLSGDGTNAENLEILATDLKELKG